MDEQAEMYSAVRRAVLSELRRVAPIQKRDGNQNLFIISVVQDVQRRNPSLGISDIWQTMYEMFYEGILVPLSKHLFHNPATQGVNLMSPECFSVTDFGFRFLELTKGQPDPFDATTILEPLRKRGIRDETVENYVPEAVRALRGRAYRGVFVLIGVASEALSEDLYDAFEGHLPEGQRSQFREALKAKKFSAEAQWNVFTNRFPHMHESCIGEELAHRFQCIIEPQLKFFKLNRDDAAHRRASLITPETAQSALTLFVPFGITIADVLAALSRPCSL